MEDSSQQSIIQSTPEQTPPVPSKTPFKSKVLLATFIVLVLVMISVSFGDG